jgi:hypothetical protein
MAAAGGTLLRWALLALALALAAAPAARHLYSVLGVSPDATEVRRSPLTAAASRVMFYLARAPSASPTACLLAAGCICRPAGCRERS